MKKFYIEMDQGIKQDSVIVWDAEKGQELCTFTNGELDTDDEYITEKLILLGYSYEKASEIPEPEQTDDDKVIEAALREKAKDLGIKHWHMKSIDTLTAEIAEKEGA